MSSTLPGKQGEVDGLTVQVASSKSLAGCWWAKTALPEESKLTLDRYGLLAGEFRLPLSIDLTDCMLAHGEKLYRLGTLNGGAAGADGGVAAAESGGPADAAAGGTHEGRFDAVGAGFDRYSADHADADVSRSGPRQELHGPDAPLSAASRSFGACAAGAGGAGRAGRSKPVAAA